MLWFEDVELKNYVSIKMFNKLLVSDTAHHIWEFFGEIENAFGIHTIVSFEQER